MQPPSQRISACPTCGAPLEETVGGGGGCMFCLLQAGIGSEEETVHDSNPDAPEGGVCFGVYEIDCHADGSLCELGRGAMGVTYRATDRSLQRKVALKLIKTDIAERSADARERFVREARAAAALRHENIAVIHQFGMRLETGQYFYAMELIEGETLDERVHRKGPLDSRTTIGIGEQVTSALAAAEKQGLVHRDLKPANLMLVNADHVERAASDQTRSKRSRMRALRKRGIPVAKIIDFGLAKAFHTATDPKSLTHDRFVGTPAFASPEQFEHSALDVRSDIYSLGETLWFALTGKPPFAGHTLSEIHSAQKSNALPVEQLKAAHVPHGLKSLLESMLAFEPASRPGTVELAARLKRCSPEVRSVRRTRIALATASLVVLGMSALFVFQPERIQTAPSNPAPDKSIAVLPFENRSEDKANAYFAEGIQDEILTRLSKIADLKVISRTSTEHYKSAPRNLRSIARQLGVAHILEGSVQKSGNSVRVNVQLIKAASDSHLWADTFDRKLTDIFSVETEIARAIADQLQAKISPEQKAAIEARPTNDLVAYDEYVHAKNLIANAVFNEPRREQFFEAVRLLESATARDPSFALAYYELAHAHDQIFYSQFDRTERRLALANDAIQSLRRLRPDSGEAHLALAKHLYWGYLDYDQARHELEAARRLLPNDPLCFLLTGYIDRRQGRWDESIKNMLFASELDPRNYFTLQQLAITYFNLRQYPELAATLDKALSIAPKDVALRLQRAEVPLSSRADTAPLRKTCEAILAEDSTNISTVPAWLLYVALYDRNPEAATRAMSQMPVGATWGTENVSFPRAWCAGLVAQLNGDQSTSIAQFQIARQQVANVLAGHPDDALILCALGTIDAVLGNKDDALREGQRAVELLPLEKDAIDAAVVRQYLAAIYAWSGEKDLALKELQRCVSIPGHLTYGQLRLDPMWEPLRGGARFERIVASLAPK
jgi:serine/threonine protein kinase